MSIIFDGKTKLYHIKRKYEDEHGNWKDYDRYIGTRGFKGKKEARKADEEFRKKMENNLPDN